MTAEKQEDLIQVPIELLQGLVDAIDLQACEKAKVKEGGDRKERRAAEARVEIARKQVSRAAKDLITYLRYTHHVVPRGISPTLNREISLDPSWE